MIKLFEEYSKLDKEYKKNIDILFSKLYNFILDVVPDEEMASKQDLDLLEIDKQKLSIGIMLDDFCTFEIVQTDDVLIKMYIDKSDINWLYRNYDLEMDFYSLTEYLKETFEKYFKVEVNEFGFVEIYINNISDDIVNKINFTKQQYDEIINAKRFGL